MRIGSQMLAEAIYLAKKGIDPQTPASPMRLPPIAKTRGTSGDPEKHAERKRKMAAFSKLPQVDRMMLMRDEGASMHEIAAFFNVPYQKVVAMIDARRRTIRSGFRERYDAETWG